MHVYQSDLDADGTVRFISPSARTVGLTGHAPSGFDGGYISYNVELPCIVISSTEPNMLLSTDDEVGVYKRKHSRVPAHGRAA